jgi:hypothetical protein
MVIRVVTLAWGQFTGIHVHENTTNSLDPPKVKASSSRRSPCTGDQSDDERTPRIECNPKTGERVNVPCTLWAHVKLGKDLRDGVNMQARGLFDGLLEADSSRSAFELVTPNPSLK